MGIEVTEIVKLVIPGLHSQDYENGFILSPPNEVHRLYKTFSTQNPSN